MNWNRAELALQTLAASIFEVQSQYSKTLFLHIGTGTLIDAIRSVLPERNIDPAMATHISEGLAWFEALRAERNKYAHAIYNPAKSQKGLWSLGASAKGGKLKYRSDLLDLRETRNTAEEIYDLSAYLLATPRQLNRSPPFDPATRKFLPRPQNAKRRLVR